MSTGGADRPPVSISVDFVAGRMDAYAQAKKEMEELLGMQRQFNEGWGGGGVGGHGGGSQHPGGGGPAGSRGGCSSGGPSAASTMADQVRAQRQANEQMERDRVQIVRRADEEIARNRQNIIRSVSFGSGPGANVAWKMDEWTRQGSIDLASRNNWWQGRPMYGPHPGPPAPPPAPGVFPRGEYGPHPLPGVYPQGQYGPHPGLGPVANPFADRIAAMQANLNQAGQDLAALRVAQGAAPLGLGGIGVSGAGLAGGAAIGTIAATALLAPALQTSQGQRATGNFINRHVTPWATWGNDLWSDGTRNGGERGFGRQYIDNLTFGYGGDLAGSIGQGLWQGAFGPQIAAAEAERGVGRAERRRAELWRRQQQWTSEFAVDTSVNRLNTARGYENYNASILGMAPGADQALALAGERRLMAGSNQAAAEAEMARLNAGELRPNENLSASMSAAVESLREAMRQGAEAERDILSARRQGMQEELNVARARQEKSEGRIEDFNDRISGAESAYSNRVQQLAGMRPGDLRRLGRIQSTLNGGGTVSERDALFGVQNGIEDPRLDEILGAKVRSRGGGAVLDVLKKEIDELNKNRQLEADRWTEAVKNMNEANTKTGEQQDALIKAFEEYANSSRERDAELTKMLGELTKDRQAENNQRGQSPPGGAG